MTRIPVSSLDYYDKRVISLIVEKYDMSEMNACRLFLTSETHRMLEDAEQAMWEFSAMSVFEMWEVEQVTGDPRNSIHLREEL